MSGKETSCGGGKPGCGGAKHGCFSASLLLFNLLACLEAVDPIRGDVGIRTARALGLEGGVPGV